MNGWRHGNIWVWWQMGKTVVVPTNEGWRHDGLNVMGAGLAKEAATRVPDLPERYGKECQALNTRLWLPAERLILVPSKRLNVQVPHLSWQAPSDIETITHSLTWLEGLASELPPTVYVPLIGAGNGGLDPEMIRELMDKLLKSDKFVGVLWP